MGMGTSVVRTSVALACLGLAACGGGGGGGSSTTTTTTTGNSIDGIVQPASWNFDDGTMQGWILAPGYEGLWHVSDVRSYSPSYSLGYNDQDPANPTYNTGAAANSGAVISQELALGAAPVLDLQYFLANECSGDWGDPDGTLCEFDSLNIAVSTDGGLSFSGLQDLGTSASGFTADTIDLAAYANQTVVLAIEFDTGDGEFNDHEGAYVDDIAVTDAVVAHTVRVDTASVATGEDGTTDSFKMMLNTAPAAAVTITVSSDNTAEAQVMGGDSTVYTDAITLTFTTANWDEPQEVSVKGLTDGVVDGDQLYNVVIAPAVSLDTLYNGVDAADIEAVNTDDAAALAQCDGATALAVGDDVSTEVPIGLNFSFQGVSYDTVHVGSNGYLTFGVGDQDYSESVVDLLSQEPRISALWDDLRVVNGVSSVTCINNTANSMTVSYVDVERLGWGDSNNFDITLNSDGSVVIEYGAIAAPGGLVGISPGLGIDSDPGETDLSANPAQGASGTIYELFDAGDNDLSGATLTFTPAP